MQDLGKLRDSRGIEMTVVYRRGALAAVHETALGPEEAGLMPKRDEGFR